MAPHRPPYGSDLRRPVGQPAPRHPFGYFPAFERAFDYSKKAALLLLGGYQTPSGTRRIGLTRLTGWLKKRGCRNSAKMAEKALITANSQHSVQPTQATGSALVLRLAEQVSTLDAEIADVDAQITELFQQHESADVLLTMAGFGPVLAATFLANICGNLDAFDPVDRLASVAGPAPVRANSAESAETRTDPVASTAGSGGPTTSPLPPAWRTARTSRTYYEQKRGEGPAKQSSRYRQARGAIL